MVVIIQTSALFPFFSKGGAPPDSSALLRLPTEVLSRNSSKQLATLDDLLIPTPPGLEITRSQLPPVAAATATTALPGESDDSPPPEGVQPGNTPGVPGPILNPHPCTMCNKQFTRADDLKKHLKTSHITSNCSVCGQMFQDKIALAKHQVEVRNTPLYTPSPFI